MLNTTQRLGGETQRNYKIISQFQRYVGGKREFFKILFGGTKNEKDFRKQKNFCAMNGVEKCLPGIV